ncbi:Chondroitin synthase [Rhodocyclaceae bacterium]|nr:Chondroitin synthase [Rhodocyclaceae bacterium]
MMRPLVSIVIPSYNQGKFIRETIQSCLDQDYRPIEIIVQDGASKDETVELLKSFDASELSWVSEPDKGVADALNKGLARARGEILTIQSSDDVFLPGAIQAAVEALKRNPDAGLVYGDVSHIDEDSVATGQDVQDEFDLADYLGRFMYIPQPGTCFTRAAMERAGRWREAYSYAADADFWMRIVTRFPVLKLNRFVAAYRYHPEQRDTQKARIAKDWEGAIADLLAGDSLNTRERRYARMGIHLARYRYAPESDWGYRTRELYAALLANPLAVFDRRFPKRELIPGRTPIWAMLSRIKRALGFRPRTS